MTNTILSRGCLSIINDAADAHFCKVDNSCKLHVYDWMKNIPAPVRVFDIVEIRFKNTRKGFYNNVNALPLKVGDIVAVEASPGHDIGIVSLTGELVYEQMKHYEIDYRNTEFKKVYRKAKSTDIDKWKEAINLEHDTMIRSRKIAADLRLNMKIGDVEYQGDRTKAIFYYIANERVDFRELIKVLADNFKVRIEMKQIGARQEAGRIGGIGSCGRELCCSSWMINFISVSTVSAKYQELSLNPKKLAGQCIKLKCCLNYELDSYLDQRKDFPDISIPLETQQGPMNHFKTDVHRRMMWYALVPSHNEPLNLIPVPVERVKEIQQQNRKGIKVKQVLNEERLASRQPDFLPPQQAPLPRGPQQHQHNRPRQQQNQQGGQQNRNQDRQRNPRHQPNQQKGNNTNPNRGPNQNRNQNQNPNRNPNQNRNQNNQQQPKRENQ